MRLPLLCLASAEAVKTPNKLAVAALSLALLVGGAGVASAAVPRFGVPMKQRVGNTPVRVVAGDLNGDRKADLATADLASATLSVLLGRGDGSFGERTTYRTPRYPAGITVGDVDGDGDRDLIVASIDRTGSISVFSNRGAGRFARLGTYSSGRKAFGVAAADVNRDGNVDLLTANDSREEFAVLLGTGAGRFTVAHRYTGSGASGVAVGDLNGDGNLDVAHATTYHTDSVAVRLGVGDGTFGPATAYRSGSDTYAVALADLNHDDTLDAVVANYGNSGASVLLGAGDGTLGASTRYGMGLPSDMTGLGFVDAVVVADFDRDGHADIVTPGFGNASVRRGRGDGTLFPRQRIDLGDAQGAMGGAAVADFNRDGWPDLALTESCDYVEFPGCDANAQALVLLNRTRWRARR
jgi:FG-GAP-like repeat